MAHARGAARLLERKLAYAFASRGAGVVQWAWNINPYQPIDNESVIGLFRPDGTAKTELRALRDLAAFFRQAAPWLDDFEPDPVVMVIPHARLFSGRPGELDATRRVVRLLAEHFGVVPTALSDQRLTAERLAGARLVIVPVPEVSGGGAARALLAAARAGALVLVTGAVEGDPYGRSGEALTALGVVDAGRPVAQHERTRGARAGPRSTATRRVAAPRRKARADPAGGLRLARAASPRIRAGAGALAELLGAALSAAGVGAHPSATPIAARLLRAPRALLAVCVNETAATRGGVWPSRAALSTCPSRGTHPPRPVRARDRQDPVASTPGPQIVPTRVCDGGQAVTTKRRRSSLRRQPVHQHLDGRDDRKARIGVWPVLQEHGRRPHAATTDPQLLDHRPHRPRQVDARRPPARAHRRAHQREMSDQFLDDMDLERERGHHDQGALGAARATRPRTARTTSST